MGRCGKSCSSENIDSMMQTEGKSTQPDSRVVNRKRRGRISALQDISNVAENLDYKFSNYTAHGELDFRNSVVRYRSSRLCAIENYNPNIESMIGISDSGGKLASTTHCSADMNFVETRECTAGFTANGKEVLMDKIVEGVNGVKSANQRRSRRLFFSSPELLSVEPSSIPLSSEAVGEIKASSSSSVSAEMRYKNIYFDFNGNSSSDGDESDNDSDYSRGNDISSFKKMPNNEEATMKTKKIGMSSRLNDYIDEGDPVYRCESCHALMWCNEKVQNITSSNRPLFSLCCLKGKVQLPVMTAPPQQLHNLFFDKKTPASKNFHSNIRSYNNMFSFTSMGGKIDYSKNCGGGPYTFVLSGMNYHKIGSLLPPEGGKPVYSQLYIYDTENEVSNRISAVSKHIKDSTIDREIVDQIKNVLDEVNPFVKQYRMASSMIIDGHHSNVKICLISSRYHDGRNYNLPSASEVAALIVGDIDMNFSRRDVIVHELSGAPQRIDELHASYLPLQYPILFPKGEDGYRDDIQHREETLSATKKKKRLSIREYFAYRLMSRYNEISTLLHAGKLLQQFIVDGYTMIESQRLLWFRTHQKELRADLYQGLTDAFFSGERNASSIGKRIILPSSFTGGARYMLQNYKDAMAICGHFGYPSIFLTFTCNPAWPEITRACEEDSLSPTDRPEILSRIFELKLKALMSIIKKKKIFGTVRADVYTIEFKKRGLPHAHILLWLDEHDKLKDPNEIDKIISAEIPDRESSPQLYDLVKRFMVHGPCGRLNTKSPCMKDNKCSKYFPKNFVDHTTVDEDGFPTYRRRDDGRIIEVRGIPLDNRFVVPFNPTLLTMFQAHINVEKCNQSTAIKYLFKYISKGNDRVVASIYDSSQDGNNERPIDEIQQYYNYRYISACEAAWRIFAFNIHHMYPAVERLSFHLPNQQYVVYSNTDDVEELLNKPRVYESMFLAWMKKNGEDDFAKTLTYSEFPQHYVYQRTKRLWKRREKGFAIGRVTHIAPSSGELYYLRILITKVKGPKSFEDIRTVNGIIHPSFRDACFALGLLDDDNEYINAIKEASVWASGSSLRKMFVTMLLCSCLSRPDFVWSNTSKILSEDLLYISRNNPLSSGVHISDREKEQVALKEIELLLQENGKSLQDFPSLPSPPSCPTIDVRNHLILQELSYDRATLQEESRKMINSLNLEQSEIFDIVLSSLTSISGAFFFVYGYGGTGKTFLWNALTSTLRARGDIVLTVASSGIAATLLPSRRTAHSRFAIPIHVTEDSVCNIKQNSSLANLIQNTKLIIWDEAPMVQRYCLEAFDRSLRDIMHSNYPFGGKCILMGGDFRQILPVIPKGSRADIVNACISSSYLWDYCKIFKLTCNMRLSSSSFDKDCSRLQKFSQWLLDVGDGKLGMPHDGTAEIEIPEELLVVNYSDPISAIISSTYPNLVENLTNSDYFNDRAILAPTIEIVNEVNDYLCSLLPGEPVDYFSCDSVCKSMQHNDGIEDLYTTEFLNNISSSGLPMHKLTLKVGTPIMLLRNIDQASGLCNGTRLRVTYLGKSVVEAITLNGSKPNQKVLIHRMDMNPSDSYLPFRMRRRQFPISLSFAMTINKSQGQSLRYVGLYLPKPVFTHGQLYVALSRVRCIDGLKILVHDDVNKGRGTTINIVYREVFRNLDT